MLNLSTVKQTISAAAMLMMLGVQAASAAPAKRVFIGTANIPVQTAIFRCNNIAAQVKDARAIVSVNYLKLAQCDLATNTRLTDEQSKRFGRSFTFGR
jgi:hypothetical protein